MAKSSIQQLADFGQSVWLDYISRPLLETDQLKNLIDQGLRGMTSNPSIFNNAIGSSSDYDAKISELKTAGKSTFEIYDALTIQDIQDATEQFKGVFEATDRLDGYVSLEINPLLATKVEEQASEGKRLFKAVNRPNVMIKVPSTPQGISVIEELVANGINVNVTLIFSLEQYIQTVGAYLKGLERLDAAGGDLSKVRSVASVFISRIDSSVDKMLDEKISSSSEDEQNKAKALKGKAAVANTHIIFDKYKELFASERFKALEAKGANIQRALWGSTSTKNPDYSDVKYVEELIAAPTVNTIPEPTLKAFLDHGKVKEAFDYPLTESIDIIDGLKSLGIDINVVNAKLLADGCAAFDKAFEDLLNSIESKANALVA